MASPEKPARAKQHLSALGAALPAKAKPSVIVANATLHTCGDGACQCEPAASMPSLSVFHVFHMKQ